MELDLGEFLRGKLMAENKYEMLSPTVEKVLDEYILLLQSDEMIQNEAAERLDSLLRNGKVPKFDEIDQALFPSSPKSNI